MTERVRIVREFNQRARAGKREVPLKWRASRRYLLLRFHIRWIRGRWFRLITYTPLKGGLQA